MSKISIRFYNDREVRAVWDEERSKWWFSAVDIVAVITESQNPRMYWSVIKTRLKKANDELTTRCSQPKLTAAYGQDCFKFTDNFIRITLPISEQNHASDQSIRLVSVLNGEIGRATLQNLLSIKNRDYFRTDYLNPAITNGYVEPTIPDKPNARIKNIVLLQKDWH